MTAPALEVRRDADDGLDEVIASGIDIHLERLDDGVWWLGITHADGRVDHVTLATARGAAITGRIEENVG